MRAWPHFGSCFPLCEMCGGQGSGQTREERDATVGRVPRGTAPAPRRLPENPGATGRRAAGPPRIILPAPDEGSHQRDATAVPPGRFRRGFSARLPARGGGADPGPPGRGRVGPGRADHRDHLRRTRLPGQHLHRCAGAARHRDRRPGDPGGRDDRAVHRDVPRLLAGRAHLHPGEPRNAGRAAACDHRGRPARPPSPDGGRRTDRHPPGGRHRQIRSGRAGREADTGLAYPTAPHPLCHRPRLHHLHVRHHGAAQGCRDESPCRRRLLPGHAGSPPRHP